MEHEKLDECLDRLMAMSIDSGQTWDLSPNDQHAIRMVFDRLAEAQKLLRECVGRGVSEAGLYALGVKVGVGSDHAVNVVASVDAAISLHDRIEAFLKGGA